MRILITGITTERRLSDFIYDELDIATQNKVDILTFDKRGTDSLAQSYLASKNYRKVTVLTKNGFPAVNAAGWPYKNVSGIEDCVEKIDGAFVVWDGIDVEIFDLIFAFLSSKKPVRIYLAKLNRVERVTSKRDLHMIGTIA